MKKDICIVVANYYPDISKKLINGATKVLKISKIRKYKVVKVPGIFLMDIRQIVLFLSGYPID